MKLVEPCCYVKQLNNYFPEDDDVSFLYHSGDVLLQDVTDWMLRRSCQYPGLNVTLAVPCLTPDFAQLLGNKKKEKAYSAGHNTDYPLIRSLSLVTRSIDGLDDYMLASFDHIAITRNLSLQAVTMAVGENRASRHLTLTGGLVQTVTPGIHLMVLTKTLDKYNLIQPMLDSHLRLHKIK